MLIALSWFARAACPDVTPLLPTTAFDEGRLVTHEDMFTPLDDPAVVPLADGQLDESAPVMRITAGSATRLYPVDGIAWHHVVNDVVGDEAIAVTF